MSTAGLSLVGFKDPADAVVYLANQCVPDDPSQEALLAQWNTARARLGPPIERAGRPEITPLPPELNGYIQQLMANKAVADYMANLPAPPQFAAVEIDPLLAYQPHVDLVRSEHHCGTLARSPALGDLLPTFLPIVFQEEPYSVNQYGNSILIKARSLNLRMQQAGFLSPAHLGIQFGLALPLVHVVRYQGRCYLHNGFHRVVGARAAGATRVPCLLRDILTKEEVGAGNGGLFDFPLLESENPPTLAHFTEERAHPVQVRATSRIMHISWAEYVVNDE